MGTSPSSHRQPLSGRGEKRLLNSWKRLATIEDLVKKYIAEGLLDPSSYFIKDEVELISLLDDDEGFHQLLILFTDDPSYSWLECWELIRSYKRIDSNSLLKICDICIKKTASLVAKSGKESLQDCRLSILAAKQGKRDKEVSGMINLRAIYRDLKQVCFRGIFKDLYFPVAKTRRFEKMLSRLGSTFNQVTVDDFEYYDKLGSGSFGIVLHCKKLTTGRHYAMKVMLKSSVLRFFRKRPEKVMVERNAMSSFKHPYITSLAYAFQTNTLIVLVMPLCRCGDLGRSLRLSYLGRFSFERVQFYAAEIVSALSYLHANGIIYRDLKPQNILLDEDGHISLTDFGNIADTLHRVETVSMVKNASSNGFLRSRRLIPDSPLIMTSNRMLTPAQAALQNSYSEEGDIWSQKQGPEQQPGCQLMMLGEHTTDFGMSTSSSGLAGVTCELSFGTSKVQGIGSNNHGSTANNANEKNASRNGRVLSNPPTDAQMDTHVSPPLSRAKSLVGTLGYMAPEVMQLFGKKAEYTKAADCWSLGVLIYYLYTGQHPFRISQSFAELQGEFPPVLRKNNGDVKRAFIELFGKLKPFAPHVNMPSAWEIVTKLLEFDPVKRLSMSRNTMSIFFQSSNLDVNADQHEREDIRSLAFFEGINWDKIEHKSVIPPYIPMVEIVDGPCTASPDCSVMTFKTTMRLMQCENWVVGMDDNQLEQDDDEIEANQEIELPRAKDTEAMEKSSYQLTSAQIAKYSLTATQQVFFKYWNWVSPEIIDSERSFEVIKSHTASLSVGDCGCYPASN